MSRPAYQEIRALFDALVDLDPGDQARRLAALSTDQSELKGEVEALLTAERGAGDRFERGPVLSDLLEESGTGSVSLVDRVLGPYRVTQLIGRGGMGAVYEAVRIDGVVSQRVAIKTIWRGADSKVLARRFHSERRILAALRHPAIAQFLDAGSTEEGTPYLIMEFVEGMPLDQHCDANRLSLQARLDLFLSVCSAVHHAHRSLVIHRDLKPSNVLVTGDGQVKLLDFGVAKLLDDTRDQGTLTGAGLSPFTVSYAAPEQVTRNEASTAVDVYALGGLLTVLLAGRPPLDVAALSPVAAIEAIRDRPPAPPSQIAAESEDPVLARNRGFQDRRQLARALGGELDAIALMALRKEPNRRYSSVDAMAEDVKRYLRRERVMARPDTVTYRLQSFIRRRRSLVAGIAIAIVALGAATIISLGQARASRRAAARSERIAGFLARVATADPSSLDPIARLGSRGTVAQLLDSLVRRIPVEFADDEGIRARLYASIGPNYTAQGRSTEAERVLDSAVILSRRVYGPRSDEFAAASLEMAATLRYRAAPEASEHHVLAALGALAGREKSRAHLYARGILGLAIGRDMQGKVREADSLARVAYALELGRTPDPTPTRANALVLLAQTVAWIARDPRVVDTIAAHAVAISDSLHTPLAAERLQALYARINALVTLGRYQQADSLLNEALRLSIAGYGVKSREVAVLYARGAELARARGELGRAHTLADSAWEIGIAMPEIASDILIVIGGPRLVNHWSAHQYASADSTAELLLQRVASQQVPIAMVFAAYFAGLASSYAEDWPRAERRFRQALASLPATGDLNSMAIRIGGPLATALTHLGQQREADSIRATLPPDLPAARCRPGGDWRGC